MSSDDATDWVTIKIPETVRDQARDMDGHTYHELMTAGMDAIQNGADLEDVKNELSMANEPGVELDVERVMDALETVEERTGRIERTLEDVEGRMR